MSLKESCLWIFSEASDLICYLTCFQEDDVPQNDLEKDAATGPMTGNVVVCFAN